MTRFALLAALLLTTTASGAPVARPYSALKAVAAVERGDKLLDQNKFDEAMREFDAAVRLDPNNAKAYRYRGYAQTKKFDWFRALCDYDRAIQLAPTVAELYSGRAVVWRELGEYEKAFRDVNEAVRIDPQCATTSLLQRGAIHAQKGDWEPAFKCFDEVIALDPRYADAFYGRGMAWGAKGNHLRALADFHEAIKLDPKHAGAFANRGMIYKGLKDWNEAKNDLDSAIRLGAKSAVIFTARADVWAAQANWERVLADLDSALAADPEHKPALEYRSLIRSACPDARYRDVRKAHDDAKRLCELTEWKYSRAISYLANAHAEAGQFDEAVKLQKRAIECVEAGEWRGAHEILSLYEQKQPFRVGPTK